MRLSSFFFCFLSTCRFWYWKLNFYWLSAFLCNTSKICICSSRDRTTALLPTFSLEGDWWSSKPKRFSWHLIRERFFFFCIVEVARKSRHREPTTLRIAISFDKSDDLHCCSEFTVVPPARPLRFRTAEASAICWPRRFHGFGAEAAPEKKWFSGTLCSREEPHGFRSSLWGMLGVRILPSQAERNSSLSHRTWNGKRWRERNVAHGCYQGNNSLLQRTAGYDGHSQKA